MANNIMSFPLSRSAGITVAEAEGIAARALGFLAGEPQRLVHFLELTGIGLDDLRARAGAPGMLAAVLDHVARDESLLLVFAADSGLPAEQVARAAEVLGGAFPR